MVLSEEGVADPIPLSGSGWVPNGQCGFHNRWALWATGSYSTRHAQQPFWWIQHVEGLRDALAGLTPTVGLGWGISLFAALNGWQQA